MSTLPEHKRWKLSPLCLLLAMAACGIQVVMAMRQVSSGGGPFGASYIAGRGVGAVLAPLLIGWIVYMLGRRSSKAGNVAFGIAAALLCVSAINGEALHRRQTALREFTQRSHERSAEVLKEVGQKGYIDNVEQHVSQAAGDLDRTASQLSGTDAAAARAAATVTRRLGGYLTPYNAAAKRFLESGGMDPKTLTTMDAIAKRRTMLDEFARANTALLSYLMRLELDFIDEARREGAPERLLPEMGRQFAAGGKRSAQVEMRQDDAKIVAEARTCLKVLGTHHGHWNLSPTGTVVFDTIVGPEVIKNYNASIQRLQAAGAHQLGLQKTLLAAQQ